MISKAPEPYESNLNSAVAGRNTDGQWEVSGEVGILEAGVEGGTEVQGGERGEAAVGGSSGGAAQGRYDAHLRANVALGRRA